MVDFCDAADDGCMCHLPLSLHELRAKTLALFILKLHEKPWVSCLIVCAYLKWVELSMRYEFHLVLNFLNGIS